MCSLPWFNRRCTQIGDGTRTALKTVIWIGECWAAEEPEPPSVAIETLSTQRLMRGCLGNVVSVELLGIASPRHLRTAPREKT